MLGVELIKAATLVSSTWWITFGVTIAKKNYDLKLYIIMYWFEFVFSCQIFFIIIFFGDPRKVKYYALSCDFFSQKLIMYFINSELLKNL
jgi:hypothetical protein